MRRLLTHNFLAGFLASAVLLSGVGIRAEGLYFNFANLAGSVADVPQAVDTPKLPAPVPSGLNLESMRELKIATYNIQDLLQDKGKSPSQLKESARAILDIAPDIIVLQEVENIGILGQFNSGYLNDGYFPFLIEGNDGRGIDVAFLVKKNLPFSIENRTNRNETWSDPASGGAVRPLFSRDLPALIVRAKEGKKPLFILFGTHFKSKRTVSPGDPEANIIRKAQVDRTSEIIKKYQREFGQNVPILLAGDFNGSLHSESAFGSFWNIAGLTDTLDLLARPPPKEDRVTHAFFPRNGEPVYEQIDAVLVSPSLRTSVKNAGVYRYKDRQGNFKRLPENYQEREQNPSDHYPVAVTLDFQSLLNPQ